jgi:tRNA nucleotidyltransferase (CCA-adding enzyme)
MKKFLVGGAVRDRLLGRPVKEHDWVVVGETPESMIAQGFRPVGKDFPVFLHPETHEEYALARTERKTAPGYRGFAVHAAPDVTLTEDLLRRDLTINAMAMDEAGCLIDPCNGSGDLAARILRHASPAFSEDPVRILRVARFAARYAHLGFTVAEETQALMRQMVASGEVDALVAERVWVELARALAETTPEAFFDVLRACGALARLFPEIERLFGVPQPAQYHPEIDTGVHTLMVLHQAARLSADPKVRFAALTHDLGKGLTPKEQWPSHRGHERAGLAALETLCERLRAPKEFRKLAAKVMLYHGNCHRAFELRPSTLVDLLHALDAMRPNSHLESFLLACEADARGRTGFESRAYDQADYIRAAHRAALSVDITPLTERGLSGEQIGKELRRLRVEAVSACRAKFMASRAGPSPT